MTNNLKEEIEKLIVETDTVIKIDKTTTSQFLPPQFYVDRLVDRFYTLINQKEKELLDKFEEAIGEDQSMDLDNISVEDWHAYNDGLEKEYQAKNQLRFELRKRIKQLKEELKGDKSL